MLLIWKVFVTEVLKFLKNRLKQARTYNFQKLSRKLLSSHTLFCIFYTKLSYSKRLIIMNFVTTSVERGNRSLSFIKNSNNLLNFLYFCIFFNRFTTL